MNPECGTCQKFPCTLAYMETHANSLPKCPQWEPRDLMAMVRKRMTELAAQNFKPKRIRMTPAVYAALTEQLRKITLVPRVLPRGVDWKGPVMLMGLPIVVDLNANPDLTVEVDL